MIAVIEGEVLGAAQDSIVVMVGGLGLRVYVTTAQATQAAHSKRVFLHTHLVVREDALTLFGFETEPERDFFVLLLGANGVGPRIALAILSTLSVDAIRRAVFNEQSDVFARVSGVGKKTAQKILLHLQGKVGGEAALGEFAGLMDMDTGLLEALTTLGYSVVEAQAAIQSIPRDAPKDEEERLRMALQYFSS